MKPEFTPCVHFDKVRDIQDLTSRLALNKHTMTDIAYIRKTLCILTLFIGLMAVFGCAKSPTVYSLPTEELESMRDEISSVAVVSGQYKTMEQLDLPAKGVLAAGGRGFVSGVGATIAVGVVSPVPGGTIIGIVLSPIGGVVGFFRGMVVAEPTEKIEAAEQALNEAAEKLRTMNLGDTFREDFMALAAERTGKQFRFYEEYGPLTPHEKVDYDPADFPGADTVLEIRPIRAGLWGLWTVNPPASPFAEVGIRLIRLRDGKVLIDDTIMCAGEERSYEVWATNSDLFVQEIVKCVPRLVGKIVDDTFLVNALSNRR